MAFTIITLTGWLLALAILAALWRVCGRKAQREPSEEPSVKIFHRLAPDEILRRCLERIEAYDMDDSINGMLQIIGEAFSADRVYTFVYTDAEKTMSDNNYEWVAPGVIPFIDQLKNTPVTEPWKDHIATRSILKVNDFHHPPEDLPQTVLTLLGLQGVRAIAVVNIYLEGSLIGFMGIDYVDRPHEITPQMENVLKGVADLYSLVVQRNDYKNDALDKIHFHQQFFTTLSVPIILFTPDFKILDINNAALAALQLSREQAVGLPCQDVLCHQKCVPDNCPLYQIREKGGGSVSFASTHHGHHFMSHLQPVYDRENNLSSIIEYVHDVTLPMRYQKELEQALQDTQAAERTKMTFLATMSHELRTPLNAIIGFSEILQQPDIPQEEKSAGLSAIQTSGQALLTLINDVIEISRLESDTLVLNPEAVCIREMAQELLNVFRFRSNANHTALQLEFDEAIPPALVFDKLRVRQILFNLLGNAVKFTRNGTITLRVAYRDKVLTLAVADTGEGISPEFLKNLFTPFAQDEQTSGNQTFKGSGLGLPITKRLIENMHGELHVESEIGKGSVFTVTLPGIEEGTLPLPETPAEEPDSPVRPEAEDENDPLRLLIVDDVPMNLSVLERMLDKLGVDSTPCLSGEEALSHFENGRHFDAVMTDLWMPGMSGQQLCARIRALAPSTDIPIYAITADTSSCDDCFAEILYKPVTIAKLQQVLSVIAESKALHQNKTDHAQITLPSP